MSAGRHGVEGPACPAPSRRWEERILQRIVNLYACVNDQRRQLSSKLTAVLVGMICSTVFLTVLHNTRP